MKNKEKSVYATNKGGYIKAPTSVSKGDPKATVKKGNDLRVRKG